MVVLLLLTITSRTKAQGHQMLDVTCREMIYRLVDTDRLFPEHSYALCHYHHYKLVRLSGWVETEFPV